MENTCRHRKIIYSTQKGYSQVRLESAASGRGISMKHICEGPINAKQSTQVLEQRCQPDKVFFTNVVAYFSKTTQNNSHISQQQIFIEKHTFKNKTKQKKLYEQTKMAKTFQSYRNLTSQCQNT